MKLVNRYGCVMPLMKNPPYWLCCMLFGALLLLFGFDARAQNAKITLNVTNAPLEEVFNQIEKQTDYSFFYTDEIDIKQTVSVRAQQESLDKVLDKLFANGSMSFKITDKRIVLYKDELKQDATLHRAVSGSASGSAKNQKSLTVTGVISNAEGETLPGVAVVVKGTNNGTTTNIDGKYTIVLGKTTDVLQYSFLGYQTQEISPDGKSVLNISMKDDAQRLDEVVVTGVVAVNTYAANWHYYPNVKDENPQRVDCSEWGCSHIGYMKWWFSHLPHFEGINPHDGKLNNWWHYVVDYNEALLINQKGN